MKWINIKDQLPSEKRYVLVHVINRKWYDYDDDPSFRVAKLIKSYDCQTKKTDVKFYEFCYEHIFKIDEIDYWCEIDFNRKFKEYDTFYYILPRYISVIRDGQAFDSIEYYVMAYEYHDEYNKSLNQDYMFDSFCEAQAMCDEMNKKIRGENNYEHTNS